VELEWDSRKAAANLSKHGVDFADAATVVYDDQAITIPEERSGEERFVTIHLGEKATPRERRQYEGMR